MVRVLVTGGCGFIGSNLIRMLLRDRSDVSVRNLDVLSYSGNPENLAGVAGDARYEFVRGDVSDPETARVAVAGCDAVIHMAAESHVDRSIAGPRPFVVSNTLGTQALLEAWRRELVDRRGGAGAGDGEGGMEGGVFVNVSTDEVYGSLRLDEPGVRFTEDSALAPSSVYSASKAGADQIAHAYWKTFGMRVVTTRCSNNFGAYQFPEKVIPLFVTNLMEGKKVPLYGDGRYVRDWIHVDDHCAGVVAVMDKGLAGGVGGGEVYNFGADNERSNLELTRAILAVFGMGEEMIERVEDRPGHDLRYAIDASKARRELGWEATRSAWPGALEETVAWYRANEGWWRRVQSGAYREGIAAL